MNKKILAGEPGFEPGLTESESAGLPLTYSPRCAVGRCPSRRCGGLINKTAANANTFWQKNAISMWRQDFCTDLRCRRRAVVPRIGGRAAAAEAEVLSVTVSAELAASGLSPWRRSQKQFGEWGLRWYSRVNEKSRERFEQPMGLRGAMVETSERPRSRRKAVRIRGVGSRPQ